MNEFSKAFNCTPDTPLELVPPEHGAVPGVSTETAKLPVPKPVNVWVLLVSATGVPLSRKKLGVAPVTEAVMLPFGFPAHGDKKSKVALVNNAGKRLTTKDVVNAGKLLSVTVMVAFVAATGKTNVALFPETVGVTITPLVEKV
jgi:hypothetical protein